MALQIITKILNGLSSLSKNKVSRNLFIIEQLETRLLFSADLEPIPIDRILPFEDATVSPSIVETNLDSHSITVRETVSAEHQRHELMFVDTSVPDYQKLVDDFLTNHNERRQVEVVILDSSTNGIEQISETLSMYKNLDAVHVVSHGTDGAVQLGNTWLRTENIDAYAEAIEDWKNALTGEADLLFYGCDLASGKDGRALINNISLLTGADVAASDDLTGNKALGGDWTLEYATGSIEASIAVDTAAQQAWAGILAISTGNSDSAATSGEASSLTFSHTVTAGANGLLVVEVATANKTPVSSVTYGGTSLTFFGSEEVTSGEVRVELWYLKAPIAGTANIEVNLPSSQKFVAGATSFLGVDQTTPFGAPVTATGNSSPSSVTVASAPGSIVIDIAALLRVTSSSVGAGQTQLWTDQNGSGNGDVWAISSSEPGAASVTMTESFTATGGAGDKWAVLAVAIQPVNTSPPVISSNGGGASASISVNENTTAVTTVTATDADGWNTLTYSIIPGVDSGNFMINSGTGVLSFSPAPDYEAPADNGANNFYDITVQVTDGQFSDTQVIQIAVNNVNENPVISSNGGGATASISVNENTTAVTAVTATDPDLPAQTLTYSIVPVASGGAADAAKFTISASGVLSFISAPDYENPTDADLNNVYQVTVRVSDGNGGTDSQTISVTVNDIGGPLTVDTTSDTVDGTVTSVEALLVNRGADGKISLREAILATNATAGSDTIYIMAGTYTLTGVANEEFALSGDLDIRDSLTIIGEGAATTIIDGNAIDRVIEIMQSSTVIINDVTIRGGDAGSGIGGGLNIQTGSTVMLTRVAVNDNTATGGGGGIYSYSSTVVLTDSTFSGNSGKWGGGIYNDRGTVTVDRVTVSDNTAEQGAGIYTSINSSTALINSTVSSNTAAGANNKGGAIYTQGTFTINSSTIVYNSSLSGGGIYKTNVSSVTIKNTIFAYNTGGNTNTNSGITSQGYNIDSENTLGLTQTGDMINTDPLLNPTLGDNGGYTQTHALQNGSPAIDPSGLTGAPATDQRGIVRDALPDIGAFESTNNAPTISGGVAGQTVNDTATITPFSGVTISDADIPTQTLSVSVTLDTAAKGTFTTLNGFTDAGGGVYTFSGTAAAATTAIRGLVFDPADNRVTPGSTETTTFTISVNDGSGAITDNTTTVISTSINNAPTAISLDSSTVAENISGAVIGTLSTTDPDTGDTHTYTVDDVRFEVVAGQLKLKAGQSLNFEAEPTVDVTVTSTDAGGLSTNQLFTITVTSANEAPVAVTDNFISKEDTALTLSAILDILGNDTDVEGHPLTITGFSQPGMGTLIDNGDGTFTYIPDKNFNGTDSFTYQISDGNGGTATGTAIIIVTPVGDTPQVMNINTLSNTQSGLIIIDRNASDGAEVTHFRISGITNGTLYLADGVTQIHDGDFITYAQAQAGLRFTPAANSLVNGSFNVQSSQDGVTVASQDSIATSTISVIPPEDVPTEDATPPEEDVKPQEPDTSPDDSALDNSNIIPDSNVVGNGISPVSSQDFMSAASNVRRAINDSEFTGDEKDIAADNRDAGMKDNSQTLSSENLPATSILGQVQNFLQGFDTEQALTAAYEHLRNALDAIKKETQNNIENGIQLERVVVGSAVAVSTGLSVGYVLWLVRGGMLLSSVLASIPAWQNLDPLPILSRKKEDSDSDDSESLETIIENKTQEDNNNEDNKEDSDSDSTESKTCPNNGLQEDSRNEKRSD